MSKTYIGDSVYADIDERGLVLTTENGDDTPSNTIVLEDEVFRNLLMFVELSNERALGNSVPNGPDTP